MRMHPKKKEKEKCDAATDPPDPLDFDPFDLDGRGLLNDWREITPELQKAVDELKTQNTTGAPKVIKNNVVERMERVLRWMNGFARSLDKARTVGHRLQCIECDVREIKATTEEIKATTKEAPPAKTWAQIAANNNITATTCHEYRHIRD